MNYVSFAALIVVFLYLVITFSRFGIQKSISDSWYRWLEADYSSAFTIFCYLIALCCFLQWIYPYKAYTKLFVSLAGGFMAFIGIASNFKEKLVGIIHNSVTIACIVFGMAAITYQDFPNWYCFLYVPLTGGVIVFLRWKNIPFVTTVAEIIILAVVFGRLLFVS